MDLYKLITLILILNIGTSMAYTFSDPNKDWLDFVGGPLGTQFVEQIIDIDTEVKSGETPYSQQNENTLEQMGGLSAVFLIWSLFWVIIAVIILGGLVTSMQMIYASFVSANTIFSIITIFTTIFFTMIYVWLTLKIISWAKNKDTT